MALRCVHGRSTGRMQQDAGDLFADLPAEARGTETAEILVEVVERWHEVADRDALDFRPLAETVGGARADIAVVAGDDELSEAGGARGAPPSGWR